MKAQFKQQFIWILRKGQSHVTFARWPSFMVNSVASSLSQAVDDLQNAFQQLQASFIILENITHNPLQNSFPGLR